MRHRLLFVITACCLVSCSPPAPPSAPPKPDAGKARKPTPEEEKKADMAMPFLDRSSYTPESREPALVDETERNPFGQPPPPPKAEKAKVSEEEETMESKLRRALGAMRISGFGGVEGDYTVLLGPMHLREGDLLPKLFSEQKEMLRVEKIDMEKGELLLAFVGDSAKPRTIGVSFDTEPRISSMMVGEAVLRIAKSAGDGATESGDGVQKTTVGSVEEYIRAVEAEGRAASLIDVLPEMMGDLQLSQPQEIRIVPVAP